MDYKCVKCKGKVVYVKPEEPKITHCNECRHYNMDYRRVSRYYECEECKNKYYAECSMYDTDYRPRFELEPWII